MKISEGMKLISKGWAIKPRGFRVRFQTKTEDRVLTDHSPGLEENPLVSDVVAWRYAWKLCMATQTQGPDIREGEMVNITVVNDQGEQIIYYATNRMEVFNTKTIPDGENPE